MNKFIGHIDTLLNYDQDKSYDFFTNNDNFHVDLVKMKKAGIKLAVFAVYVESKYKPFWALERTLELIDRFHNLIESSQELQLIKDLEDIESLLENDKIGALLAIEGGEGIFSESALRILYRLDVRMIALTWNQRNQLADGIGELETNGGLTTLGKKILSAMEELGIILDVSHLAPAGFWDIVKIAKKPFLASHSNVLNVCNNKRNLDDEQLKAIAENKGLIGLNFAPAFLVKDKKADISDVIRHIDYIRDLVGIENIVLGTDYDGIDNTPKGLEDLGKLDNLKEELLRRNYSLQEIEQIFILNWLNFFRRIWG
ncbi:MAG: dipeptidase [Halanaerobiales bacterium]|jgi:membrane dipeptidase|nr:dipeptidase [Halanaerobiales bacterium]HPZ63287.1 dipeptidase [Halanaerobiales bacterium]HQD04538.1 dipeptidase [Halanaerobiales bacterium]